MQWNDLNLAAQAKLVLECVPLTQEQYQQVLTEWATRTYPDTYAGEMRALDELQELALAMSLPEGMKQADLARRAKEKQKWLSR